MGALARILDDPAAPAELLPGDLRVAMVSLQSLTGVGGRRGYFGRNLFAILHRKVSAGQNVSREIFLE